MPRRGIRGMRLFEAKPGDTKFIRISYSMLKSPTFKSLSYSAIVLYLYMRMRSAGREDVTYALSYGTMHSSLKSKTTVNRAIDELVKKGFITITQFSTGGGHVPRKFKFSSMWIELDKILENQ